MRDPRPLDLDLTDQIMVAHDLIVTAGLGSEGPGSLGAWGGGGTRRRPSPAAEGRRGWPIQRPKGQFDLDLGLGRTS